MISRNDFSKKQILIFCPAQGDTLSFRNDNAVIKDKDKKIKRQVTCYQLFAIFVIGHTTITTGLIQRAYKFGFSICLFSMGIKLYSVIGGHLEGNTLLRKKQYEYQSLDIGQHIIHNKIKNQRCILNSLRDKTIDCKRAIRALDSLNETLLEKDLPLLTILGIEGSASKTYFSQIYGEFGWRGRKPRTKIDYINSTLDIGYTVLFNVVDAVVGIYGFDTYYGVLHRCFYMRKSLICDLMEPFRPVIDMAVRKGINLRQIKSEDFEDYDGRYVLKFAKSAEYTAFFMKAIMEYKEPLFLYIQGYYRKFMKNASAEDFPTFEVLKK